MVGVVALTAPKGLGTRGKRLWKDITAAHDLDPQQRVLLEEACRTVDRLDMLEGKLSGREDAWVHLRTRAEGMVDGEDRVTIDLVVDNALSEARQQQNILKQLLAAMRLPDQASGARPQQRGGARGAYAPKAGSKVVSLADRFG